MPQTPHILRPARQGFTLVELLVVVAIIAILATIAVPAIRTISKGNDQAQAVNLIRSMIGTARSIAISQHRQAGVVFFEETSQYSNPINTNQTAMQLFVEDYNQQQYNPLSGMTVYIYYSTARQYLPNGVKVATLSDSGINFSENTGTSVQTRAVLFDANGQLITRGGIAAPDPSNFPIFGDWRFLAPNGSLPAHNPNGPISNANASSSPGFFLYNKNEFDSGTVGLSDLGRYKWLIGNADVVIINPNTGTVIR